MTVFRRLFGTKAAEDKKVSITLDTYFFNRKKWNEAIGETEFPFTKLFPTHMTSFPGAFDEMLGYCSSRGAAYLIDSLGKVRDISLHVVSDYVVASEWKGTFINLGSSASNQKTDHIKHLPQNLWLREDINGPFQFKDGSEINMDDRIDKGIVMKLPNPYFPGYALFICAGLGEWGTSGSAWFLSAHWRKLSSRFGKNPFLIVVSVSKGSDETADEIRAYGNEAIRWRICSWFSSKMSFSRRRV